MAGGANYGGNTGDAVADAKAKATSEAKAKNNDVTGSVVRPTVTTSTLNQGLDYSNREQNGGNGGGASNALLSYAYSRLIKTSPVGENNPGYEAAPSLFNEYSIVYHPRCDTKNKFFDIEGEEGAFPKFDKITGSVDGRNVGLGGRQLKEQHLIESAPPFGIRNIDGKDISSSPYFASDFLYSKHFRKIPLNHLITLRRYPFPVYDNMSFDGGNVYKPLAQAITYFGEPSGNKLADLTKFNGYINWEEFQADVYDVEGDERGLGSTPFIDKAGGKAKGALAGLKTLTQSRGQSGGFDQEEQERQRIATDPNYTNEVLGPVNVIDKTNIRKRGIGATQDLNLVFEYQLRSYANINPRIAMVDLMCNMLALCFNNAKFWGGANRYFPALHTQGFMGDQSKFYEGDYKGYMDSIVTEMSDGIGKGVDLLKSAFNGIMSGDLSGLTNILKGAGTAIMDVQRNKSRPKIIGFRALLTGLPIGEWHLVVGNPFRPITQVGNLIVTSFDFELDGALSADDFPSLLKFTINLQHGRPRDKGDLESMFNLGEGRVYHAPEGRADVGNLSASTGVKIKPDNKGNKNNKAKRNDTNYFNQPVEGQTIIETRGGNDVEFVRKLKGTLF